MKISYDQGCNDVEAMKWEPLIIQGIVSKFHILVHNNS